MTSPVLNELRHIGVSDIERRSGFEEEFLHAYNELIKGSSSKNPKAGNAPSGSDGLNDAERSLSPPRPTHESGADMEDKYRHLERTSKQSDKTGDRVCGSCMFSR
ncbi:unnamed protein product [Somion occarium]|uniref:Uncharacterized protein n=1 Tax=Somion occarium TaxID=3059160 RepID=A0ABP1D4U8_9APHY